MSSLCDNPCNVQTRWSQSWAKKYPEDRFELAVFEDMTKNAAFDDAVKGLDCQYLFVLNARISVFLIHPTISSYSAHNHSVRRSSAGCTLKRKELS